MKVLKTGVGIFEVLIAMAVLLLISHYSYPVYERMWIDGKRSTIVTDLSTFRQGIEMYKITRGKNPEKLQDLIDSDLISFDEGVSFAKVVFKTEKIDSRGNFIDPFGNIYEYNSKTGEVWSTTEGYEDY